MATLLFLVLATSCLAVSVHSDNNTADDTACVVQQIQHLIGNSESDDLPHFGPTYLALRSAGRLIASGWIEGRAWNDALAASVEAAQSRGAGDLYIEVVLTYDYRTIDLHNDRSAITNVHRGVRGIELTHGTHQVRYGPTEMLARNLSFDRAIELFLEQIDATPQQAAGDIRARIFEAHQFLVFSSNPVRVVRMFRGNHIVEESEITQASVRRLADQMSDWLIRQVHPDGRMTYRYFPSRGTESNANNLIRQFMATICLIRVAKHRNDQSIFDLVDKNLQYNFDTFFQIEQELGYVIYNQKVKLGGVALAALAIAEHPSRDRYVDIYKSLLRMVDYLWQPSGRFRTWYKPSIRDDNHNFYPGEALLLWATLYAREPDSNLYERFMQSFQYYRDWHRNHRNPAFVPWHTQAYYLMWQQSKDPALVAFIFEMNDWLLSVQQWENVIYADLKGRFYDPARPYFGPPHASSTGVYLEGLIDAFALADTLGDHGRREKYRIAIVRGLRSVMQLQFDDEIDMYYVSKRDYVHGGLRTCVYHNCIRIDNVQHNLMAILKILERFDQEDFAPALRRAPSAENKNN